ncbi:MAG: OmpH family outer membrane protein [bacterium]
MKKILLPGLIVFMMFLISCDKATEPEKMGVMNLQKVLEDSIRAQAMHEELLEMGNELELEYNTREDEMSSNDSQAELEEIYQEYMEHKYFLEYNLNQEIERVIEEIALDEGIDVVVESEGVFYGGTDITEQVIDKLDELGDE